MKAIKEFLWYKIGDEIKPEEKMEDVDKWIEDGLVSKAETVKKEKVDLDVNNDGVVDDKDVSIMASALGKIKKKKGKKK